MPRRYISLHTKSFLFIWCGICVWTVTVRKVSGICIAVRVNERVEFHLSVSTSICRHTTRSRALCNETKRLCNLSGIECIAIE